MRRVRPNRWQKRKGQISFVDVAGKVVFALCVIVVLAAMANLAADAIDIEISIKVKEAGAVMENMARR